MYGLKPVPFIPSKFFSKLGGPFKSLWSVKESRLDPKACIYDIGTWDGGNLLAAASAGNLL
jgi:hypothetical protein